MGMLARLSQAAYLLGRVFKHTKDSTVNDLYHVEEREQLDRTLRALLNLSYVEGAMRRMAVCAQTGICYSALITLHDSQSNRSDAMHHQYAMSILKPVAEESALGSQMFMMTVTQSVEDASPLLLHWAYQAATVYGRLIHDT
ncbi:hypothetical protein LTR16_004440, partial [Cryomyces antarcticus]